MKFKKVCSLLLAFLMAMTIALVAGCGEDDTPLTVNYTVTFDVQGHGTAPSSQTVEDGKYATAPSDPAAEGWTFGGWYKEAGCTNPFAFATQAITSNTTIYAKWTKVENKEEEKDPDPVQLAKPVISLSGNVISWEAVEHADGYTVKEGTDTVSTQTDTTYTINKTEAGSYTYTVIATSTDKKYSSSEASEPVTYTKQASQSPDDQPVQLAKPVISLSGNVLSWEAVEHADGYIVKEGTDTVSTQTGTTYTIVKTEVGSYTYTVIATSTNTAKYTASEASNPETYTVNAQNPSDTSAKLAGKVYLVGDSTVCSFSDAYYIPRYGYGTQLSNYLNCDENQIVNLALSGRSSYSFVTDPKSNNYSTLTTGIAAGDYLIIGFGHNDEKREVERYTDPTLGSDSTSTMIGAYNANRVVSFKRVLKQYYIDVAIEKGATPILCTPITRLCRDNEKQKYDTMHVTTTTSGKDSISGVTTTWNGGDYAEAIRELAEELDLLCVDLTTITKTEYKQLDYAEASKYHAATGAKWTDDTKTAKEATGIDETHTNLYGAKMNAYHIANAIKSSNLPLASNVKTNITKPVYADYETAMINASYTIPDKEAFDPSKDASNVWTGITGSTADSAEDSEATYNWYATSFGANAKPQSSYFTITQGTDADGLTFTLKAEGQSKIESKGDSIAAVFIQVPFKTAFTVTAKATVTSYGGNQAGFGLMVRDDIYIDLNETVTSNYVAAGCYGTSTGAVMCYARNGGTLEASKNKVTDISTIPGTYELSLARTSQSITANMNDYSYSAVSDFDLAVSDSEYVYVCLWVCRSTEVTFSNITFTSDEWVNA